MVTGLRKQKSNAPKRRHVCRKRVALTGIVSFDRRLKRRRGDQFVFHVVDAEIVGEIELCRRPGLHTRLYAGEVERGFLVEGPGNKKSLAVVVICRGKNQSEIDLSRYRPGRVARKNVDVTGLKRFKSPVVVQGNVFDFTGVVENRGGNRPGRIDIESAPVAVALACGKSVQSFTHAAVEHSSLFNGFENLRMRRHDSNRRQRRGAYKRQ